MAAPGFNEYEARANTMKRHFVYATKAPAFTLNCQHDYAAGTNADEEIYYV